MKLDRKFQLEILNTLAEKYPNEIQYDFLWAEMQNRKGMHANMAYLIEHGLIDEKRWKDNSNNNYTAARILAAGMDFLADDGGLSAILGVVTVKIHEDSIRALLLQKVETTPDLPDQERSALAEAVRNLPARSIQTVADKLIAMGVEHLPTGAHALHTWIDQAISLARGITG